jgi:hypothetical protein
LLPSRISAQVVINEFSSSTSSDWVELYAYEDIDISGWILDDDGTETNMAVIPESVVIGPSSNAYYVVEVSNRLNVSGDIIKLLKEDSNTLIDEVSYGNKGGVCVPSELGSIARIPDANPHLYRLLNHTKGQSNGDLVTDPCPTPTPEPTATFTSTPKPTATPKPAATLIPTKTPTTKPTIKPTKTKITFAPIAENSNEKDGDTLGIQEKDQDTSESTDVSEDENSEKKFPILAGVFIAGGLGFIGAAAYPFLKDRRKQI